jgi:hypothetical protein
MTPAPNGSNGRGTSGRFTTGNTFGKGNPFAQQYATMRAAFMRELCCDDVSAIARELVNRAKSGDMHAIKLVLAYGIGTPAENAELVAIRCELEVLRTQRHISAEHMMPVFP